MQLQNLDISTPAFVYDLDSIHARVNLLREVADQRSLRILYSIKSASFSTLLDSIADRLQGLATSSLFESRFARGLLGDRGEVHLSTVVVLPEQIEELSMYCNAININSLEQWRRHGSMLKDRIECGLRINPMTDYVNDSRFDPCRKNSKLGVPLDQIIRLLKNDSRSLAGLNGLQFHNNCESREFSQLVETCRLLLDSCGNLIRRMKWINIGGGYLFNEHCDMQWLADAVILLEEAGVERVYFEPGKAIVGDTGYLVASVVDIFRSGDRDIAILDCSVNHVPEVFEFQYRPEIYPECNDGEYIYRLAGMTCLSGDLFGDYRFEHPLELGDRIVFRDMGAYMFVKASMFNGFNIPPVYLHSKSRGLELINEQGYEDYRRRLT